MKKTWWSRFWRASTHGPRESSLATQDAAKAMCGAGLALHNEIKSTLGGQKVENRDFVEFMSELLCYFLHLLDRELSKTTLPDVRAEALDDLVRALAKEEYRILYQLGFDVNDGKVLGIFQAQYNQRQIEYGSLGTEWFQKAAVRFGEHATDALETPEDIRVEVALKCGLLAPAIYSDLSSALEPFLRSAWKRSHEARP